jgi:hypothetical protein
MSENESGRHGSFLRQRRNLFIISIGLLLFQVFELKLTKISFLGNEFSVSQPELIPVFLWITYIYYIVRYYQFFHEEPHRGVRATYERYILVLRDRMTIRRAKWIIIKDLGLKIFKGKLKDPNIHGRFASKWRDDSTVSFSFTTKSKGKENNKISIKTKTMSVEKKITIRWYDFLFIRLQAFLHVCFRTSHITEYYIPFVVATFPCLWYLFAKIFLT